MYSHHLLLGFGLLELELIVALLVATAGLVMLLLKGIRFVGR